MDIVFGTKWFEDKQQILLWFLNTPIISIWFRWCLRIRKYDCNSKIYKITPNSLSYNIKNLGDKIELTTDFRTHDKYSKRLYFAFKPFWYLLHFFDWAMLDRVEELTQLSFGFSTLTQYPNSSTSVNGYTSRDASENWATKIAGAGTFSQYNFSGTDSIINISSVATLNLFNDLTRSIFLFDTSSLTSGAIISSVIMSIFGSGKLDNMSITPNIDVYTSTPASNTVLANSDFQQFGSTSQTGSPITYTGWSTTGYNDFTFNATGISNVSKTSISKFGCRNANYDVSTTQPTWASNSTSRLQGNFSDGTTSTSPDPKLVVTYILPISGGAFLYNMI
jgi:hypothetical protein